MKLTSLLIALIITTPVFAQTKFDTTYVIIDNATINKLENTFEFVLIFESKNKQYEIYREYNRDYSVEFDSISFKFKCNNLKIEEYVVHDLPTGRDKSIIRDIKTNNFYLTDWYNNNNNADALKLPTLNFSKDSVSVEGNVDKSLPDYKVALQKIW
ncbi:MAG TPA: hypothetical protein VK835_04330, partial [Bacteroidia bacterium]|nr:hypothetical protein [Bacteroidia bacterium]